MRKINLLPLHLLALDFLSVLYSPFTCLFEDLVGNDLAEVWLLSFCKLHHSFVLFLIDQLLTGLFAFL